MAVPNAVTKVKNIFVNRFKDRTDVEKAYALGVTMLGFGLLAAKIGEMYDQQYLEDSNEVIDITDSTIVEVVDE